MIYHDVSLITMLFIHEHTVCVVKSQHIHVHDSHQLYVIILLLVLHVYN